MTRLVVPELRNIPLTWLDCPDYGIEASNHEPTNHWCLFEPKKIPIDYCFCEGMRIFRCCPRGFR